MNRYVILFMVIVATGSCKKSKLPDLRETYSYRETKPFGTYAAKKIIETGFPYLVVQNVRRSFTTTNEMSSDSNAIYFCISRNLFVTEDDAQSMLDYVYKGNSLFISAANIDTNLLSRLLSRQLKADVIMDRIKMNYATTHVNLSNEISIPADSFGYYYKPFANAFTSINANYSYVLGYNELKLPNSFILFWGKGRMIVHCDPRAFSNYFLLKNNNYLYLQKMLSLVNEFPTAVYWDDYYRTQNTVNRKPGKFSALSEIMKHPALANAFWIFLAMLIIYILFNSKRRQRIIPVIRQNDNSSIAFTETIARLYLQHHDNKNIADKMITYFNEFIRKSYFLNAGANNSDFISALSRKSGVSFEQTTDLFATINEVNNKEQLDDQQLLKLNDLIQQFYKNRN